MQTIVTREGTDVMMALRATNDDWNREEDTPLARALADLALQVARQIVVRSPIVSMLHETTHMSETGLVHELTVRAGIRLRGPMQLVRLRWPPARPDPSNEPPRRA